MIDTGRQFDRNLLRENSTFLQQQKNRKEKLTSRTLMAIEDLECKNH